jgi:DNA-binding NarL/FixJ family response regulator
MRVLIIAEHKQAAEAIGRALRYGPPCRVIGYLSTRGAGEGISWHVSADVVVIDERRPDARTARLVRAIRAAVPDAKLVLLTDDMDAGRLAEASAAGLDAAVARSAPPPSVGMLVRDVAAGRVYHAFERPRAGASASAGPAAASVLTSRELEILRLVAGGLPNGSIAKRLFVTEQTVKFHLSNVYRKLGLRNRTEASHYAHVHGLLEPESDVEIRGSVPVAA